MNSVRLLLYFSLTIVFCVFMPNTVVAQMSSGIATVVIDPGHGGVDPGAVTPRSKEKNITLAVSLKVGALINRNHPEVKVYYTRTTDKTVDLEDRPVFANSKNADLFISIHVNSVKGSSTANGTETWVMGVAKTSAQMELVKAENSVILLEDDYNTRYQGFDPNSPASYIMFSMMQNAYINQSLELASMVQQSFRTLKRTDRGVKQGGLWVLWRTTMPSILVELGFLPNPAEERYMNSESGQDDLAQAIYEAFRKYKQQVDSRSVFRSTPVPQMTKPATPAAPAAPATSVASEEPVAVPAPVSVAPQTPSTADAAQTRQNIQENTPSQPEIEFYVQIMASPTPIKLVPSNFRNVQNVEQIAVSATLYKYVILRTTDYNRALSERNRIRSTFKDAFIFAMKDGKIIPVDDALKELKK